jgi:hypothetical protein
MGYSIIEGTAQKIAAHLQVIGMTEIMPKSQGNQGQKNTTVSTATVLHGIVAFIVGPIMAGIKGVVYFHFFFYYPIHLNKPLS